MSAPRSSSEPAHPGRADRKTRAARRLRLIAVLLIVLGGAAGLIASTQTWFTVTLHDTPDSALTVAGAAALPVVAPLSLAALALGAALTIAGRILTYSVGVLTVGIGGMLVALTAPIALPITGSTPLSAVASTVTEATGIAGDTAVAALIERIDGVGWGIPALIGGLAVALAGILILVTAHRWQRTGRRYRTNAAAPGTSGAATAAEQRSAGGASSRPDDHVDAFDAWDGLSRGDDPTN